MENSKKGSGVFQLPNGYWGFRFRVSLDGRIVDRKFVHDADGKPFKTEQAAKRAKNIAIANEKKAEIERQREQERIQYALSSLKHEPRTVSEVYEEYRQKGRSDRAYTTIRKQDSLWDNHLKERFGDRFVGSISSGEILDYLSELYYCNEYAYKYVESFLKMFYLIFGQAYSRGYLPVDTYDKLCRSKDTKIHMPKVKIDDDLDIVAFTDDECRILNQVFKGTNAETAYLLGRYCGLRINEAYGLKWSQVDLDTGVIHIRQQMAYQQGLIKLVPLKTKHARRDVYLNSIVIEHLRHMKEQLENLTEIDRLQREQNQKYIAEGKKKVSSLELVNCLLNGKIQTVNSMKYYSRLLKEKYNIDFKYHHLRHTYGTQLAVMNTPAHILCDQMGHGNIQVTQRYYIAISERGIQALKANLEKMDG